MSVCIKSLLATQVGYLTRGKWVWDKKFFSSFLTSMMTHKTPILGKLSMNTEKRNQEKIWDKNRHFLEKESFIDFPTRIEKRCFGLVGEVGSEDCICIDEVDIAKPCAEKMEWLSQVHDGSTGAIVNGYMFHGASISMNPRHSRTRGSVCVFEEPDMEEYHRTSLSTCWNKESIWSRDRKRRRSAKWNISHGRILWDSILSRFSWWEEAFIHHTSKKGSYMDWWYHWRRTTNWGF